MTDLVSGYRVSILLISASEEARDEVGNALVGWSFDYRLHWVSQPSIAMARAEELLPDIILIDDTVSEAEAIPLVRQLVARVPRAKILFMATGASVDLARQAVLAGARGFVTKPLRAQDLTRTLNEVLTGTTSAPPPPVRAKGRVIVFCAPKGGTGRTTLAINTAVSLRSLTDEPVLLVDADYAAPALDVALNVRSDRTLTDLLPRLAGLDDELFRSIVAPHASGISVLLSPPPFTPSPAMPSQVQALLVTLKGMFPWVVVDQGLPIDDTAFAFLDGADAIVVVALPEMVGLRNVRLLLDQFQERGHARHKVWLVLNRSSMAGGVPRGDIQTHLEAEFRHTIPDDQLLASHSINRGVPLVMSHRRSAVARAIRDLAGRLLQALGAEEPVAEESPADARAERPPRRAAAKPASGAATVVRDHAISISLFGLAVILFVVVWFLSGRMLSGLLLGLIPALVGIFVYRRGK
jgi:pilus assembly protein CpaE